MKPRRTFESVVNELIEGLNSGEIALTEEAEKKESAANIAVVNRQVMSPPDGIRIWDFVDLPGSSGVRDSAESIKALKAEWNLLEANCLSRSSAQISIQSKALSNAVHRAPMVWFIVGSIQAQSFAMLGALAHHKRVRHEVRIIVTYWTASDRLLGDIQSLGLSDNLRFADVSLDGWVMCTGDSIFWHRSGHSRERVFPRAGTIVDLNLPYTKEDEGTVNMVGPIQLDFMKSCQHFCENLWSLSLKPKR
jgi:hypothetical protein